MLEDLFKLLTEIRSNRPSTWTSQTIGIYSIYFQAYHLCMLDYNFIVMNNAFLVHKPGVKKKKIQNLKFKDQKFKNIQIIRSVKKELTALYGMNKNCSSTVSEKKWEMYRILGWKLCDILSLEKLVYFFYQWKCFYSTPKNLFMF